MQPAPGASRSVKRPRTEHDAGAGAASGFVGAGAYPPKMSKFKPLALGIAQELGGRPAEQQVDALLKVNKRKEVIELLGKLRKNRPGSARGKED